MPRLSICGLFALLVWAPTIVSIVSVSAQGISLSDSGELVQTSITAATDAASEGVDKDPEQTPVWDDPELQKPGKPLEADGVELKETTTSTTTAQPQPQEQTAPQQPAVQPDPLPETNDLDWTNILDWAWTIFLIGLAIGLLKYAAPWLAKETTKGVPYWVVEMKKLASLAPVILFIVLPELPDSKLGESMGFDTVESTLDPDYNHSLSAYMVTPAAVALVAGTMMFGLYAYANTCAHCGCGQVMGIIFFVSWFTFLAAAGQLVSQSLFVFCIAAWFLTCMILDDTEPTDGYKETLVVFLEIAYFGIVGIALCIVYVLETLSVLPYAWLFYWLQATALSFISLWAGLRSYGDAWYGDEEGAAMSAFHKAVNKVIATIRWILLLPYLLLTLEAITRLLAWLFHREPEEPPEVVEEEPEEVVEEEPDIYDGFIIDHYRWTDRILVMVCCMVGVPTCLFILLILYSVIAGLMSSNVSVKRS